MVLSIKFNKEYNLEPTIFLWNSRFFSSLVFWSLSSIISKFWLYKYLQNPGMKYVRFGSFQSFQVIAYFLFLQLEFQEYFNDIDSILFCWKSLPSGKKQQQQRNKNTYVFSFSFLTLHQVPPAVSLLLFIPKVATKSFRVIPGISLKPLLILSFRLPGTILTGLWYSFVCALGHVFLRSSFVRDLSIYELIKEPSGQPRCPFRIPPHRPHLSAKTVLLLVFF